MSHRYFYGSSAECLKEGVRAKRSRTPNERMRSGDIEGRQKETNRIKKTFVESRVVRKESKTRIVNKYTIKHLHILHQITSRIYRTNVRALLNERIIYMSEMKEHRSLPLGTLGRHLVP